MQDASEHFHKNTGIEASLLELKTLFESTHALVGRCGLPENLLRRASLVLNRGNPIKDALINAEKRLEQITQVRKKRKHCCHCCCRRRAGGWGGIV